MGFEYSSVVLALESEYLSTSRVILSVLVVLLSRFAYSTGLYKNTHKDSFWLVLLYYNNFYLTSN